MEYLALKLV
ncbi:UNVERIFIED_CONTAM: hypothetical protein GTU68_065425 [Idotea baltica]|nr:hypothetical protein [Idotea baltica]